MTKQERAMTENLTLPFPVRSLSPKKPTWFDLKPDAQMRATMAQALGITAVYRFTFKGALHPVGRRDVRLEATLETEVEQPCSVTLAPVRTSIKDTVHRLYLAEWQEPTGAEIEIAQDDMSEPLPDVIDVGDVALEALALALPLYPRAPGAELGEAVFAEPGAKPLTNDAIKPFAGLAALKDKLGKT